MSSTIDSTRHSITSPALMISELTSSVIRTQHHHRRRHQSLAAVSDVLGKPSSDDDVPDSLSLACEPISQPMSEDVGGSKGAPSPGVSLRASDGSWWSRDRIQSWLAMHKFSDAWQAAFEHLDIPGSQFLDLGRSGGNRDVGFMARGLLPQVMRECERTGSVADSTSTRMRDEGRRLRKLVRGLLAPEHGIEAGEHAKDDVGSPDPGEAPETRHARRVAASPPPFPAEPTSDIDSENRGDSAILRLSDALLRLSNPPYAWSARTSTGWHGACAICPKTING